MRKLHWKSAVGALALIIGLPLAATAVTGEESVAHGEESGAHSSEPALQQEERTPSKLLSLRTSNLELVEPRVPTLVDGESWVHPIAGTEEQVPYKGTRIFGAERPGNRPAECGQGHCGVDLDAPRGTPVVAVRPGIIEKVKDDKSASGGRYVWIQHDDIGLRTEYFHLDQVAPDLHAGDAVVEGEWLGTLGRTGIEHSVPHLHFAVRDMSRGNRYVDPKPFLEGAKVMALLDLRLPAGE